MEDKIKQLKEYAKAYALALNFDYVPDSDDLDDTWEFVEENLDLEVSIEELEDLLEKYAGYDIGDVTTEVFNLINEL